MDDNEALSIQMRCWLFMDFYCFLRLGGYHVGMYKRGRLYQYLNQTFQTENLHLNSFVPTFLCEDTLTLTITI